VLATLVLSAVVAQATSYEIAPASAAAGFDLEATLHTVHGSTERVTGGVRAEPEPSGALALTGKIEIGAASIATGNEKRDATLHGITLLVGSFPTIVFEPERFEPSGSPGADGANSGTLTGRLTIRGKTRPQSISATLALHNENVAASGTFDVAWPEFGIPDPSFFVVRVKHVAHAHFRAEFVPVR
jgi:polyisoprenoid-binding protein YceI